MAEEKKQENEKEIQAILSDLDAILSHLEASPEAPQAAAPALKLPPAAQTPSAAAPPPAPAAKLPPISAPPESAPPQAVPAPAPAPKLPPIPEPPADAISVQAVPAAQDSELKIELGPRPAAFKPAAKKPEAAKPAPKPLASEARPPLELGLTPPSSAAPAPEPAVQTPPPAAAPPSPSRPAAAPAPAPAAGPGPIPDDVDKELVRRVAFVCAPGREQENAAFLAALHKAAMTISRKPLYLRVVLNEVLSAEADVMILAERIRGQRAVAALGVLEGLPAKQIQALGDSLGMSNVVFKPVKLADIESRAAIVDLLVDLMILRPES